MKVFGEHPTCAFGVYALAQVGLVRYFWRLGQFNLLWQGRGGHRLPLH